MAQGHTQGRLEVVGNKLHAACLDFPEQFVAQTHDLWEAEANARRLAACWNACLGLSTAALEADIVADFERTLHHWDGMAPSIEKHMGSDPNIGRCANSAIQRTSTVLARIP